MDRLDLHKIPRSKTESARAKTGFSEREVSEDTSKEEKQFATEISQSGDEGALHKSSHHRRSYINHSLIRITALLHLIAGSIILIISGAVLFALPSFVFYITFIVGFCLFLPGVVISFGLVNKRSAQNWARYMIPLWRWLS